MAFNTRIRSAALGLTLLLSGAAQASEFMRVCHASLSAQQALLEECKSKARPFKRNFLPGGHGPPVAEEHAAWFDTANADSHFGFGCTLGARNEVRFFGIYFFLKRDDFLLANSAPFSFIDFNGNVALSDSNRRPFTLLAVHRLTLPGQDLPPRPANCDVGQFNPTKNETRRRSGTGFELYRISETSPLEVTRCIGREMAGDATYCSKKEYRSFLNDQNGAVVYSADMAPFIIITDVPKVYVETGLLSRACRGGYRNPLEYMNFVKELCEVPEK